MKTYLTKDIWFQKGEQYLYPIDYTYEEDEIVMTTFALLDHDNNIIDSEVVYT
jgi:hypothetical protein